MVSFNELISGDKLILVDFTAEWCGPCRMIGPIVEDMSSEYDGKAVIAKLNVDENPEICSKYGIRNIPTVLFFKGGDVADKQVGAVPKNILVQKLDNLL